MEKSERLKEIARQNFEKWSQALLTKDPKAVAALYSEDASFLPTVSPDFKHGTVEAEEYFIHFLEKNPEGKVVEETVQLLNQDSHHEEVCYLHSGLYDFLLDDGQGGRKTVQARFSFVWVKTNAGWKILHHHSSVKPA